MIDISTAFAGGKKVFAAFITAGDPTLEDTKRYPASCRIAAPT